MQCVHRVDIWTAGGTIQQIIMSIYIVMLIFGQFDEHEDVEFDLLYAQLRG